jgi:hypothetical protein
MYLLLDSQKLFDSTKKHYMHPNSESNQVTGIQHAVVELLGSYVVREFNSKVFPDCKETKEGTSFKMKDTTLDFHFT